MRRWVSISILVLACLPTIMLMSAGAASFWRGATVSWVQTNMDLPYDHGYLEYSWDLTSSGGGVLMQTRLSESLDRVDDPLPTMPPPGTLWRWWHGPYTRYPRPERSGRPEWGSCYFDFVGCAVGTESYRGTSGGEDIKYILLPYWVLVAPWAIVDAWLVRRCWKAARARRVRAGYCPVCGYDLRASPVRCPECGTVRTVA